SLHRGAYRSPRDLASLAENLADLKDRHLALVPHDFHNLPLSFGKGWQFWVGHVDSLVFLAEHVYQYRHYGYQCSHVKSASRNLDDQLRCPSGGGQFRGAVGRC